MNTPTMQLLLWADKQGPDIARDLANAITLAQRAHRGQLRRSGDPYVTHPIAVALILAEHGPDPTFALIRSGSKPFRPAPSLHPSLASSVSSAIGDELDTLSAATLRIHGESQQVAARTTIGAPKPISVLTLHSAMPAAVHVLPTHCRARWIQEWEVELCAAADLQGRLRFAAAVLRGLPTMAVLTRRTSTR